jgi:hypothetical protein
MATTWNLHRDDQVRNHELYDDRFWGRLVQDVALAASDASAAADLRYDNIRRGLDVVETTAQALNPNWWDRAEGQTAEAWYHRTMPVLCPRPQEARRAVHHALGC